MPEETATHAGGRDPATEAPLTGRLAPQRAAVRQPRNQNAAATAAAEEAGGRPDLAGRSRGAPTRMRPTQGSWFRSVSFAFCLAPIVSVRPPHRPALLAAGTHG